MKFLSQLVILMLLLNQVVAQDFYQKERVIWLAKAASLKPVLKETIVKPKAAVTMVKYETAFQGWQVDKVYAADSVFSQSFKKLQSVILDFGEHLTGHFTFKLEEIRGVADAPTKMKFTFGEVPAEINTAFDPFDADLSRGWLQDEIISIGEMPATFTIERRLAFRYVKIELLGASRYFDFKLAGAFCKATTSASQLPAKLTAATDPLLVKIDQVGQNTLKECMQTVYEDGPKRDRRLWIGDLLLESLANNVSFKNHNLTKRCLYLLAGLSTNDGYLPSNVFERPTPHNQKGAPFLFEYSLLYNAALLEYLKATNDKATALELWKVAKKQMDNPKKFLLESGLFDIDAAAKTWWLFVDWKQGLDKQTALQGIIIMTMKNTYELAKLLGKEKEVADLPQIIEKMTLAAKKYLYDAEKGYFISGNNRQVSYASQAWMILSGVANNEEGKKALTGIKDFSETIKPGGPYLMHYYIEAMIKVGMNEDAKNEIKRFWGGMVNKGADTFWEVYDPENDYISPYRFYPINSYCHAWSCTPVYFIRKYPAIFQN